MNEGIVFFTDYQSPLPLLVVALYSLRQHYGGNIHVIYGANTPRFFIDLLKNQSDITFSKTEINKSGEHFHNVSRRCWNIKPIIHQQSPYDVTLLYDCDHAFYSQFDKSIFQIIQKYKLISCHHVWEKIQGRNQWRSMCRAKIIKEDLKLACGERIPPVNGGCVGSFKSELLNDWLKYIDVFANSNNRLLTRVPDEYALSYILEKNQTPVIDSKWSYSPLSEDNRETDAVLTNQSALAIHFAAGKYTKLQCYQSVVFQALQADYLGLKTQQSEYRNCNQSFPFPV